MTTQEAGKIGGAKVAAERGKEYFSRIGKLGGAVTAAKGSEHFSRIGAIGGRALREKYGPEHYRELGRKGSQRMKELIAKGREKEAA